MKSKLTDYSFMIFIFSALFSSSFTTDDDSESDGSVVSPCSPEAYCPPPQETRPFKSHRRGHGNNLLGW